MLHARDWHRELGLTCELLLDRTAALFSSKYEGSRPPSGVAKTPLKRRTLLRAIFGCALTYCSFHGATPMVLIPAIAIVTCRTSHSVHSSAEVLELPRAVPRPTNPSQHPRHHLDALLGTPSAHTTAPRSQYSATVHCWQWPRTSIVILTFSSGEKSGRSSPANVDDCFLVPPPRDFDLLLFCKCSK